VAIAITSVASNRPVDHGRAGVASGLDPHAFWL